MNLRTVWSKSSTQYTESSGPIVNAVRPDEQAFAPGAQKLALAIEHDDRMLAAIEDKDVARRIGGHAGDFDEAPVRRAIAPSLAEPDSETGLGRPIVATAEEGRAGDMCGNLVAFSIDRRDARTLVGRLGQEQRRDAPRE